MRSSKAKNKSRFDAAKYLETAGVKRKIETYRKGQLIFSQGDECSTVHYLQKGAVKLTVLSPAGKEAVIAILFAGEFFGEGASQVSLSGSPQPQQPILLLHWR